MTSRHFKWGNSMSYKKNILKAAIAAFCMCSMLLLSGYQNYEVYAADSYGFVVLSSYQETMQIGDERYLFAVTSSGKKPTFSSSNSKVASVNTYGKITAKSAGTARITAKIKNGEASCKITVKKTTIQLNRTSVSLENGESARLTATVSTGHEVTWKSDKTSVVSVDETGKITAKKPGSATITATADKTSASCKVTVKSPKLKLNKTAVSMYRREKVKLTLSSTSGSTPKWKSNKTSVATVDKNGVVTAVKNGTAIITVTVDGVSKTCEVTVKKPTVTFDRESITLKTGETCSVKATVSSGNKPVYSSSNTSVADVDSNGKITAKSAGKAYIYASEDGVKARIRIIVQ